MTIDGRRLSRRRALQAGATILGGSLAGCVDVLGGDDAGEGDVVLGEPPNHDSRSAGDLPYPIHGESLPEATVPAPLSDRSVTTTEFVGDRHVMLTFVFTRCSMTCLALTSNLVQVQADAARNDYGDEFAFLETTFDPEYDTPERLAAYGEERGVDLDAGNWYFLRPESPERARTVATDTYGVFFEYVPEADRQMENMAWTHSNLLLLVNADGYVERAYDGEVPTPAAVLDDVGTLRERW